MDVVCWYSRMTPHPVISSQSARFTVSRKCLRGFGRVVESGMWKTGLSWGSSPSCTSPTPKLLFRLPLSMLPVREWKFQPLFRKRKGKYFSRLWFALMKWKLIIPVKERNYATLLKRWSPTCVKRWRNRKCLLTRQAIQARGDYQNHRNKLPLLM